MCFYVSSDDNYTLASREHVYNKTTSFFVDGKTLTDARSRPAAIELDLPSKCSAGPISGRIAVWWVKNVVTCLKHELLLNTGPTRAQPARSFTEREGERGRWLNNREAGALSAQLRSEQTHQAEGAWTERLVGFTTWSSEEASIPLISHRAEIERRVG